MKYLIIFIFAFSHIIFGQVPTENFKNSFNTNEKKILIAKDKNETVKKTKKDKKNKTTKKIVENNSQSEKHSFAILTSPVYMYMGYYLNAESELKISDSGSITLGGQYYNKKSSDVKSSAIGGSLGYRYYFRSALEQGFFIPITLNIAYASVEYHNIKGSGLLYGPSLQLGWRWLLGGLVIELGGGGVYYLGSVEAGGQKSSLSGLGLTILLNLGWVF